VHGAHGTGHVSVGFDIAYTGLGLGRKGSEGFVLEHFTGSGTLVVAGGGKLQVHAGAVAAFADTVGWGR
jgi:uncharacterized protein (AIM24 family)